jgi:hypothetical protein
VAWVPLLLFGVTVTILGLDPWFARGRAAAAANPDDGLDELAARRGHATVAWLRETRALCLTMVALESFAVARLERERARAREPRTVGRQIDDSAFLGRIREARDGALRWLATAAALPASERCALGELDLDPAALRPYVELPWGTSAAHERACDRSAEIRRVRDDCRSAVLELARIEQRLLATSPAPYR